MHYEYGGVIEVIDEEVCKAIVDAHNWAQAVLPKGIKFRLNVTKSTVGWYCISNYPLNLPSELLVEVVD